MDKTVKTLIIVIIILVAALGVVGGVFLQGYLSNNKNSSVINQSNSSANNTTLNQTSSIQNTNKPKISASEAKRIATNHFEGYNLYGASAVLSGSKEHPIWIVTLKGDNTGNNGPPGYNAGTCKVDATTGECR